jgi:hypothetical protein
MPLDIGGFNFDAIGTLWIIIALATMIAIGGLFMYVYFSKIHPKKKFVVYSRTGIHNRTYRLYYGKVPTELDIMSLLLGQRPTGFPINWFHAEHYFGKKCYVGQFIEGRLFPLPLSNMLGFVTFTLKVCSNSECKFSDKTLSSDVKNCPKCKSVLKYDSIQISELELQELKFNPEFEKRAVYHTELDNEENHHLPLSEWLIMYDVGAKIAEAMAQGVDETKHILDQNNPFITALIASAPLAIIMIGFGFSAYIMWQGMGQAFSAGGTILSAASNNNLETAKIVYNTTLMLNQTGMLH